MMEAMMTVFGAAFGEGSAYTEARPRPEYLERLLGSETFIALCAMEKGEVVGGLSAHKLPKFERERNETYVY